MTKKTRKGSKSDEQKRVRKRSSAETLPPEVTYSEHLREKILEATSRIVEDEGVQAATPTRIYAATGIARSTIYRHWPNKLQLLDEALRRRSGTRNRQQVDKFVGLERVVREMVERFQEDSFLRMLATTLGRADIGDDEEGAKWRKLANDLTSSRSSDFHKALVEAKSENRFEGELSIEETAALVLGPVVYLRLLSGRPLSEPMVQELVARVCACVREKKEEGTAGGLGDNTA